MQGEDPVPLQAHMGRFEGYLDQVVDDFVQAWHPTQAARKPLKLRLTHALRFTTWQSLKNARLKDEQIAELVQSWLGNTQIDSV